MYEYLWNTVEQLYISISATTVSLKNPFVPSSTKWATELCIVDALGVAVSLMSFKSVKIVEDFFLNIWGMFCV